MRLERPSPRGFVTGEELARIADLPPELLAAYRLACPTMGGRADIFVGFYEHGLDLLAPDGRLGFICPDRWMRNAYGRHLRRKILDGPYSVDTVLTMHDTPAFDSEVSAYPAITVISSRSQGSAITGLATQAFGAQDASLFAAWAAIKQSTSLDRSSVRAVRLPRWHTEGASWPEGSPEMLAWTIRQARQACRLTDRAENQICRVALFSRDAA